MTPPWLVLDFMIKYFQKVIVMILELEGKKFDLDIEKTKKYYTTHSLCNCVGCRNFYMQSKQKFPLLNIFLEKFGVDISKPMKLFGEMLLMMN